MSELREDDGSRLSPAPGTGGARGPERSHRSVPLETCWPPGGAASGRRVAGQAPSSRPGTERRRQLGQPSPPACASSRVAANSVQAWRSANSGAEA